MAHIIPFRGLRYNTEKIGDLSLVCTPPYDVISPAEQEMYVGLHPNNFIRLELNPELPTDNETDNRYTRTAKIFKDWIDEQVLVYEKEPAIYLYEEIFTLKNGETKSFKGFMTLVELAEFSKKIVLPHEETLSKAKTDRFNLMCATDANFSQVYCLYMDPKKTISGIIADIAARPADVSFTARDGVIQNLWVVTDSATIAAVQDCFADKQLFIADGHHRYETALAYRDKLRSEGGSEDELFNYIMMVLVEMDDPGLVVFPTHRMVGNLDRFEEADVVEKLKRHFAVEKIAASQNIAQEMENSLEANLDKTAFGFYTGKDYYYLLTLEDTAAMDAALPDKSAAYRGLDVSVLHTLILGEIFGIDMENMANQKNLTYTKQAEEAVSEVANGTFQCSFLLNPTKVREIKDVSLAGEKMPQKSTYFYPKILSGLVMNKFR